ncbi:MAG TPA: hypothetical protein VEL76_04630 [Gemmataceae bacterium]|nr:hypothetical protein [Gemmataceae bacterium]
MVTRNTGGSNEVCVRSPAFRRRIADRLKAGLRTSAALLTVFTLLLSGAGNEAEAQKQKKPASSGSEDEYYRMVTIPLPADVVLEVGGMDWLDKGKDRLLICTRRGEVWILDNPYADPPMLAPGELPTPPKKGKASQPTTAPDPAKVVRFKRFLFGLHEPLGLLTQPDGIYIAQRAELTRIKDTKGDDRADVVETICNEWELSGAYHEYAFGPKLDRDGNFWVTLNVPFGSSPEGKAHWRGWAIKIDRKGKMYPMCSGIRSPAGLGANADGELFYTDNQGEWVAACKLSHLKPGSFHGHAVGMYSTSHPLSPIKNLGKLPNGATLADAIKQMPALMLPAVWFPYPRMGRSSSDVLLDDTGGKSGPFTGQVFVGDQANSIVSRVFLEKVEGEYQGACFPFRQGFQCGVLRMCWGKDGSMFAGQTNRGWGSAGGKPYGLQRLVWSGKVPFEIHEMRARPDGFELTFTEPVDPATAGDVKSYAMKCWTYYHHSTYGCKDVDPHALTIKSATVGEGGKSVRLVVDGLRATYVQELRLPGMRSRDGRPLLHPDAYYTLNRIPR